MGERDGSHLKNIFNEKPTEELVTTWRDHNVSEWTPQVFDVIKEILTERGVALPAQKEYAPPTPEPVAERGIGFLEVLYGWIPLLGYPLALYNYLCKQRKRAKFFVIYSTIGLIPFAYMIVNR